MGFDFFGSDVDLRIYLQDGEELQPARYSVDSDGNRLPNPPDPDVVSVGKTAYLGTYNSSGAIELESGTGSNDGGLPLPFFRSMMTRFQMTFGLDQMPTLEIDIEPPSNDLALALLNSNVFAFGNALAVKFGYTNSPFEFFPGRGRDYELFFLLKPDVKFGDTITFTLVAQGTGLCMSQRVQRSKLYPSSSPRDIIDEIVTRAGLTMEEPQFADGDPGQGEWYASADYEQNLVSDWQFMLEVLESVPGDLTFTIVGDQFIVHSMVALLSEEPRAIFRWGHGIKINTSQGKLVPQDELPIYSFSSPTDLAFYPMSASGLSTNGGVGRDEFRPPVASVDPRFAGRSVNSVTKTQEQALLAATTIASVAMGNFPQIIVGAQRMKSFGALKDADVGMQVVQAPTKSPNSETIAANYQQASQYIGNWEASIDTLGVPTLRPGELVILRGFESVGTDVEKLNGKFLIKSMVHTIGSDGFSTRLNLLRNGTPGEGESIGGPVNTKGESSAPQSSQSTISMSPQEVTDHA
jgi:hypothetical protein